MEELAGPAMYAVPSQGQLTALMQYARCPDCRGELRLEEKQAACTNCNRSFVVKDHRLFLIDQPENAPIPKKSDAYALDRKNWSAWRRSNEEHMLRKLSTASTASVVLDLGAGRSFFRDTLNARFQSFFSVDFVPFELVDLIGDIAGKLPFRDDSFDIVISSNVFEHMPDTNLSLGECFRILRPGGILVAHTPFLMELHDEPYDFYRFTRYAIDNFLKNAGFVQVDIEPLSTFNDAYSHIARAYFSEALNQTQKKHTLQKLAASGLVRATRKMHTIGMSLMSRMGISPVGVRHPKGYGYVAHKPTHDA